MANSRLFVELSIIVLIERMLSDELKLLVKSAGIYSQLKSLEKIMSRIRCFLVDADRKQLQGRAIRTWLLDLEYVVYDTDDALTDLAIEGRRQQLRKESSANTSSKTLKIISNSLGDVHYNLMYVRKMSSKLDLVITRLYNLLEKVQIMGLLSEEHLEHYYARPTKTYETSLLDDPSMIVGRQEDKEVLLQMLLTNETNQRCSSLAIIGMGGIGKTTMAQLLYNDQKVKDHFDLMAWVCVSDDFDVFSNSKAIFQAITGEDRNFETLNQLQRTLSEKLSNKRFLLVLDDVWNENYNNWELLRQPFAVGEPGSKFLVTTRKEIVAKVMDSEEIYYLRSLSHEEAISLFSNHASSRHNFNSHPILKPYVEGIVKKCGGFPLALTALGRMLRTKESVEEWKDVLNSELWHLENVDILSALRLSYYDLPPLLKQMFIYCSLFSKDYDFDKNELVLLWVAQGFLPPSNANTSLEGIGLQLFQELVSRSFFQKSTENKTLFKMHDLINDLANSHSHESQQFLSLSNNEMYLDYPNHALEMVRHISFNRQRFGIYRNFEALKRAAGLRTFIALPISTDDGQSFHISAKVLDELLPKLKLLRVLSLSNYSITRVPKSIGTLKHIRYLNFSGTNITCLPEQVSDLYDLQILLLHGCRTLVSLPKSFSKLVKLRHLDIDDTPMLKKLPSGIGGLTSLQTLSKAIIEGSNGFNISMLGGLDLKGQLSIKGCIR